jgi:aminodeoxyfutalosine deaminase
MSIDAFLAATPKVELHLHLVGSASIDTVATLAARHPDIGVPTNAAELVDWFRFRDFPHFLDLYSRVNALVTTRDDVTTLVAGAARDLATHRVAYAEMTVTPYGHRLSGIPYDDVVAGLADGHAEARRLGVELAWVYDIPGEFGQDAARATLDWALAGPPEHLVGFGLAGAEAGVDRREFAWAFDRAIAAGLHAVPHAGEGDGPASIWGAIEALHAERIGHGARSVEDPGLVDRLVADQIPLELCPSSNVCTQVFDSLEHHSIGTLLAAGAFVTINTDDPHMFGTNLTEEYRRVAAAFALDVPAVAAVASNAVRASFLPDDRKQPLLDEIDRARDAATSPPG